MLRPAYPVRWHLRDPRNVVAAPVEPDPHVGCRQLFEDSERRLAYVQDKWANATAENAKLRARLAEAELRIEELTRHWEHAASEASLLRHAARSPVVLPPDGSPEAELLRMRAANAALDDRLAEAEGRPVQRAER